METQKAEDLNQPKRSKDPGVRVVGGRIYDSQNGKTCHQCRQKTMDFTAGCKNMKGDKQCPVKFCHKCLLNRYGENAEEMATLDNWNCPKCRDICNCSFCRKKKGHKPTGILAHTAKATGFSSVSELLIVKGHDVCQERIVKCKATSSKKSAASTEGTKQGKENSFDGSCTTTLNSQSPPSSPNDKKAKKAKQEGVVEGLKERVEVAEDNGAVSSPRKTTDIALRRSPRKFNIPQQVIKKEEMDGNDDKHNVRRSPRKFNAPQEVTKTDEKMSDNTCKKETMKVKKAKDQAEPKVKSRKRQKETDTDHIAVEVILPPLPPGSLLTNVAGIDLLPDDAGHALQFLEFCSSFGEVLNIRKGHPESVLRDIVCGRSRRKGKCSSTVQFLIQLSSLSLSPGNDKDSWIHSLKRCLSESELELEDFPEDCLDKGCDGYEMLESSQKLRLLTFLCDESLSTKKMRTWIDEQKMKFVEREKEAKESINAAREKEREAKRKLQEKIATAVLAKNGVPLTISEHDTIISKIKEETELARAELLEAMDSMPKKRRRSDAVRTDSVFLDDSGHAFWRLTCYGDSNLLLQEVGSPEQIDFKDKWFSYNAEEIELVEKYISSIRLNRYKRVKLVDKTRVKSDSEIEVESSSNDDTPPAVSVLITLSSW
uniref:DDT domain-containing protein n=1 Tax=Chenopodium quinoa TaxID=63459 RepID=A0A803LKN9_CHEQI